MSTMQVVLIIVIAVVVIAAFAAGSVLVRRRRLQQRFGPEYDRAVAETGSRAEAEKELRGRERRHAELDLRALSPESRHAYLKQWEGIQARFLDAPEEAARAGDELVTRLVAERGYPTDDFDEQLAELSVEHAHTLGRYREAHDVVRRHERGEASTEQLRQALMHYRALFAELVGEDPTDGTILARDGSARARPNHNGQASGAGRTDVTPGHEEEDHDALRH
ncbi:MAG: hypothetical protein IRZ05_12295 [Micromonosporaceae bacterium]|jgi:hypothetical protein|nr:hypothetical protein [Micromonosporaceae bacterium]